MVYRIYKDKKLICASEDKRKAFKVMRESFESGARYDVETEENGKVEKEQYYLTKRSDGRINLNKRSTTEKNRNKLYVENKIKGIHIWLNQAEYEKLKIAAQESDLTESAYVKKALMDKLNAE